MDEFPLISDHSMPLPQFGAEGYIGIRNSSGLLWSQGKTVSTQQDQGGKNKGKDMFCSDWPELVDLDDFQPSPRNCDPTSEIGSNFFDDTLWPSIFSPQAQLVPSSYFDDIDFSTDQNKSKKNPTETKQQSKQPLNYDAHTSSSSGLSDAELFCPFDDIALANQVEGCEGLEAILYSSQETRAPTPSSSMSSGETVASSAFSGPDLASAHIPRPSKKPHDSFIGAPDMILEEMAENPLDMYFPPLTTYEQPEMLMGNTTSAQKHRFPEESAGSYALNYAESQQCSKETTSAGLHGQPSSIVIQETVRVKDLGFHKLQEVMNQLDMATKGRIRDALYRLANNVEQRHCVTGSSGGMVSSGSKRFRPNGWTETQTNSMDKSVAQLLLQKPSYRKTALPHRVT